MRGEGGGAVALGRWRGNDEVVVGGRRCGKLGGGRSWDGIRERERSGVGDRIM